MSATTKKQPTGSTERTSAEFLFSFICKYFFNPIGWSFVAYGSAVAINTIQLKHYVQYPGTIGGIDSWSYAADIYSNVITILCIARFVELGLDPSVSWFDTVVDYNNTLLPVLLVHSFRFVNCDFPANVVSSLNPVLLTAVYSVKFYCVVERK
ncbi:hypothetical protein ABC855_g307 [[Candida] zeylanoides]